MINLNVLQKCSIFLKGILCKAFEANFLIKTFHKNFSLKKIRVI